MLTLTIKIKEGDEKVGIAWSTRGTKTATEREKSHLMCVMMGMNHYTSFLEEKVDSFSSVCGTTKAASDIIRKRWKNM